MKLNELLAARIVITSIAKEKISASLAYKFLKFLKDSDTEEVFYKSKLQEILNTFGDKDDNGNLIPQGDNGIQIKSENQPECLKQIAELDSTEVVAPNIQFTIKELEELKLSVADMASIFSFVKDEA